MVNEYILRLEFVTKTPCTVESSGGEKIVMLNQRQAATGENGFHSLGTFEFATKGAVTLSTKGADGNVHVDCVQVVEAP